MKQYLELLKEILEKGVDKENRTGIKTRVLFGKVLRFNLEEGFPAVTTKKLAFKSVLAELLWFLKGESDIKKLHWLNCPIWDLNVKSKEWQAKTKDKDSAGRIYGVQWRSWQGKEKTIDQLKEAIEKIKNNPEDRRILVLAWKPDELDQMCLPPCHLLFQFFVNPQTKELSLAMFQRSCDMFLGVPFNIASYSLLLHIVSALTKLKPKEFVHFLGDCHIYHNHFPQVKEQLKRKPYPLPKLKLNPLFFEMNSIEDLDKFIEEIFNQAKKIKEKYPEKIAKKKVYQLLDKVATLENYKHHPPLKAEMAV